MTRHRVVVTGMGVVSPIGSGVSAFREALRAGRSGAGPITLFDPATLPTRIAAEVKEPLGEAPFGDRKIAFALEAARQAMAAAGGPRGGEAAGVSLGVGLELFSMEDMLDLRRPGFVPPARAADRLAFLQTPSDLAVHLLSRRHGLFAPPAVHVSACAAGTDAIGAGFRQVRDGRRRFVLAGGTDSMVNPLGVGGFCKLGATSRRNDEPAAASRPFARSRDGFVLGEGAAVLVLERLEDARARGAAIDAEVVGYGCSLDAHGISEPHPEGRGAYQAMARALADAGAGPGEVECINAHGTSTPKNDPVETLAIRQLLGARASQVPVCATKSMIGHAISAAGAIEAVAAIACMQAGFVHPTINLDEPDPACDLDYVPLRAREQPHRLVLSSSFGFGGHNACVAIRRWEDGDARG